MKTLNRLDVPEKQGDIMDDNKIEWIGECCWCGQEVPIFSHDPCPELLNTMEF
jgi:hypothetical protein